MAIIKCISASDGSLTPSSIEFEPGDLVEFLSGEPASVMEVRRGFTLDDLSQHKEHLTIKLDGANEPIQRIRIHPDPKLPPPPPEDGAYLYPHPPGGSAQSLKVVIDRQS